MVKGLVYESLDDMLEFFTSPENAMMHYSPPGDSDEMRVATPRTPYGRRCRTA